MRVDMGRTPPSGTVLFFVVTQAVIETLGLPDIERRPTPRRGLSGKHIVAGSILERRINGMDVMRVVLARLPWPFDGLIC